MAELEHTWEKEVQLHKANVRRQRPEMMTEFENLEQEYEISMQQHKERSIKLTADDHHQVSGAVGVTDIADNSTLSDLSKKLQSSEGECRALEQRLHTTLESRTKLEEMLSQAEQVVHTTHYIIPCWRFKLVGVEFAAVFFE
jgi:hypothetical protein